MGISDLKSRFKVPVVAREGLVYALTGTVNRAAGLILLPLYTRDLTKAEVGAYGVLLSVLMLFQIATVTGMDSAAARWFFHLQDRDERVRTFASWTLWQGLFALAVAVPSIVLAPFIASTLVGDVSGATDAVRFTALALLAGILPNSLFNWFRLHRRPLAAGLTASSQAVGVALSSIVALSVFDLGLPGVFMAQFATGLVISIAAIVIERGPMLPFAATASRIREMLRFSLPLVPAGAAFWVVGVADRLFLRGFSSIEQVGRYQVVATVAAGVGLFTQAFQLSWGPAALSIKDRPNARAIYRTVLSGYLLGAGLICFGSAIMGTFVISLIADQNYGGLLSPLVILTGSVVVQGVLAIASVGPTIKGTSRPILDAVAVAALVNTVLNLALIPTFGVMGAAWATLAGMMALAIVGVWRSERVWRVGYDWRSAVVIVSVSFVLTIAATITFETLSGITRTLVLAVLIVVVALAALVAARGVRESLSAEGVF